jgi:hypothetical protein
MRIFTFDCVADVPHMSRWGRSVSNLPGPVFSFGILGPSRCEGFDEDDAAAPNVKL